MAKIKTYKWDTAKFLRDEEDIRLYLETMFEDGTPEEIAEAMGTVARARKMMGSIAKKAKVNTCSLYRSLSKDGTPYFKTIKTAVNSLGYRLTVAPINTPAKSAV